MPALSAADAVPLAFQRTRDFLFQPFRWGTYLKLSLVAIVTEGLSGNMNSSSHSGPNAGPGSMGSLPFHNPAAWCAAIAMLALAAILACFIFYLITRLRFAFFHCLVTRTSEIRSGWFLYRDQAARFFWLNLAVGFCFLLVMGLTALPFVNGFMRLFHENQQSGRMDFGLLLSLVLPLIPIMLLFVFAGVLTDLVLRDGMMPHYALEDASAGEAWSQVWAHVRAEKRQFIAYALLRLVLPFLAMVAIFFLLLLPGLALAGSVAAAELGIHSVFAGSSGASALVGVLVQVFLGVLAFGFALLVGVGLGGPVSTGVREYALVFYGGRYRALGAMLYPEVSRPA